jgi:hypothetical protein
MRSFVAVVALVLFGVADLADAQVAPVVVVTVGSSADVVSIDLSGGGTVVRPETVSYEVLVRNTTDNLVEDVEVLVQLPDGQTATRHTGPMGAAAIWRDSFTVAVDPAARGQLLAQVVATPAGGTALTALGGPQIAVISATPLVTAAPEVAEVLGVVVERGQPEQLPRTGALAVAPLTALAAVLVALGSTTLVVSRRRRTS